MDGEGAQPEEVLTGLPALAEHPFPVFVISRPLAPE
jgi:hypothetical protein